MSENSGGEGQGGKSGNSQQKKDSLTPGLKRAHGICLSHHPEYRDLRMLCCMMSPDHMWLDELRWAVHVKFTLGFRFTVKKKERKNLIHHFTVFAH